MKLTPGDPQYQRFYRTITSQAVVGETVGIEHYARMIPLARGQAERLSLLDDAWREGVHLRAMQSIAAKIGVDVAQVEVDADPYWRDVSAAFVERAKQDDLLGMYVIQDVVLEAYALVLYDALAAALEEPHSTTVQRIADDEREHLANGVRELRRAFASDPEGTIERVDFANERVAKVLAGWVQVEDCKPVCAVCGVVGGECAKDDLRAAGVDVEMLQPAFADAYGDALRAAELPMENVTRWLARLFP